MPRENHKNKSKEIDEGSSPWGTEVGYEALLAAVNWAELRMLHHVGESSHVAQPPAVAGTHSVADDKVRSPLRPPSHDGNRTILYRVRVGKNVDALARRFAAHAAAAGAGMRADGSVRTRRKASGGIEGRPQRTDGCDAHRWHG